MASMKKISRFFALFFIIATAFCVLSACNKDNKDAGSGGSDKPVVIFYADNNYSAITLSSPEGNKVTPPEKEGYDFTGYYTSDGIKYFESDGTQVAGVLIESSEFFFSSDQM